MNIDHNTSFYKLYHTSNKLIFPLFLTSYGLEYYDSSFKKPFHLLNVVNMGYHSYFSTSSVINDYVKYKNANTFLKFTSLKGHLLSSIGLMFYILKE